MSSLLSIGLLHASCSLDAMNIESLSHANVMGSEGSLKVKDSCCKGLSFVLSSCRALVTKLGSAVL